LSWTLYFLLKEKESKFSKLKPEIWELSIKLELSKVNRNRDNPI